MDKKIFFALILLSAVVFAQQATEHDWDEICEYNSSMGGMFGLLIVVSIPLAGILMFYGLYLIIADKKRKNLGIILSFVPMIIPILLCLIYFFGVYVMCG